MRTRAERRELDVRKALRKKNISDKWLDPYHYYDNLHQYSKNKIHCSCPSCSLKTNNKGRRSNFFPGRYWKHSDLVRLERFREEGQHGKRINKRLLRENYGFNRDSWDQTDS